MIKAVSFQVNYIRSELQADRSLRLPTRVVLGRLGGYTNRGEKECWPTNQQLAEECGLSIHAVANAIAELQERRIVAVRSTRFNNRKVRYIKLLPYFNSSRGELSQYESSCGESSSDEHQKFTSCTFKSSCSELSSSLLDVEKNRKGIVEIAREKNDDSDSANVPEGFNDIPMPDDSDFYETEENTESEPDLNESSDAECTYNAHEPANPPQTTNYTSNTNNTPSACYTNEIEENTNNASNLNLQHKVPQSPDEVMPYLRKFQREHSDIQNIDKLDLSFYAHRLFDHYAYKNGPNFTWRKKNRFGGQIVVYDIYQIITSWIYNDLRGEFGKKGIKLVEEDINWFNGDLEQQTAEFFKNIYKAKEDPIETNYEEVKEHNVHCLKQLH